MVWPSFFVKALVAREIPKYVAAVDFFLFDSFVH